MLALLCLLPVVLDHPLAGWDAHRNRLLPDPPPTVRQKFGSVPGGVGGHVRRSAAPAWYALPVPERTFADRLTASGTFAVTKAENGSGALFGWFRHDSHGWRAANELNLRVDGNRDNKYWVLFEYGTRSLLAGGKGCFEGAAYQKTPTKPFSADGTPHTWALTYDPAGNKGDGEVTFTLDGTLYTLPLAPGHKADGAAFDRFGLWNHQTSGKGIDVVFKDLTLNGVKLDLSADPKWEGNGNDGEVVNRHVRPRHDFGFSPTKFAGGAEPGEVGGVAWRDVQPAYYAAKVGPLTLDHKLEASGRLAVRGAASDSGATFGWFDSASLTKPGKAPVANRLAILIEGPSRIGHYFRPDFATADGQRAIKKDGPRIIPGDKAHTWALAYDPAGAGGNGRITFRLDDVEQAFDLAPGHRKAGATFDRFGVFVREPADGNYVELYLSELKFTAKPPG